MSVTKHKLFKIKFKDDGSFMLVKSIDKEINDFLLESNNVYVSHAITTLTDDIEEYDNLKTVCKFVLVSLVYKDLNASKMDTKTTSKKVISIVHKQIESGDVLTEPAIQTAFDKEVEKFSEKEKIQAVIKVMTKIVEKKAT